MGTEVRTLTETLVGTRLERPACSRTQACDTSKRVSPVPV